MSAHDIVDVALNALRRDDRLELAPRIEPPRRRPRLGLRVAAASAAIGLLGSLAWGAQRVAPSVRHWLFIDVGETSVRLPLEPRMHHDASFVTGDGVHVEVSVHRTLEPNQVRPYTDIAVRTTTANRVQELATTDRPTPRLALDSLTGAVRLHAWHDTVRGDTSLFLAQDGARCRLLLHAVHTPHRLPVEAASPWLPRLDEDAKVTVVERSDASLSITLDDGHGSVEQFLVAPPGRRPRLDAVSTSDGSVHVTLHEDSHTESVSR